MKRTCKILLRLYPRDYRDEFGAEMLAVFEQAVDEAAGLAAAVLADLILKEGVGLLVGAATEWIAKLGHAIYHSGSYVSGPCERDAQSMRPPGVGWDAFYGNSQPPGERGNLAACCRRHEPGAAAARPEICVNARQKFFCASPLRRLAMSACAIFLPMH